MVSLFLGFVVVFLIGQRLVELRLAARNRRWALAQGAKEVGAGHYPLFFVLHVGWFVGWLAEALWRGSAVGDWWGLWLGLFAAAQLLRYWAITTLGSRWNTRILVILGLAPIRHGPYRYVSHQIKALRLQPSECSHV